MKMTYQLLASQLDPNRRDGGDIEDGRWGGREEARKDGGSEAEKGGGSEEKRTKEEGSEAR